MTTMRDPLEQYQRDGAAFLAGSKLFAAGLYDVPGLGKTAQAIRALDNLGAGRTLVVCPAGVRQVWPHEFSKWGLTSRRIVKASTIYDATAWTRGRSDVLVCSYEQAVNWREDIGKAFFDALVLDEAHYVKNPEAGRTKALQDLSAACDRVFMLTGTPDKNDPSDLWVPLRLAGVTKLEFGTFQKRYFRQKVGSFSVKNDLKPDAVDEFRAMLRAMSIRRTHQDVGSQLPELRVVELPIDGRDTELLSFLRSVPGLSDRILKAIDKKGALSFEDASQVATLRALIAEAKAPGYARLLADEIEGGVGKVVVIAHHRAAIEMVHQQLKAAGIKSAIIYGQTSEAQRTRIVHSFQTDPNGVQVIIGNITAAGTGLTMTAANRLDMLESSWTASDNEQAMMRIYRKGQTRGCLVRFVMLAKSFDVVVSHIVAEKARTSALVRGEGSILMTLPS